MSWTTVAPTPSSWAVVSNSASAWATGSSVGSSWDEMLLGAVLLETGDFLLIETGDILLLEGSDETEYPASWAKTTPTTTVWS